MSAETSPNQCQFCQHTFVNKSSLRLHQKTAKFCFQLQGKSNDNCKCQYCNLELSSVQRLTTHLQSCTERIKCLNEEKMNEQRQFYERELERITIDKAKWEDHFQRLLSEKEEQFQRQLAEKEEQMQRMLADKDKQIEMFYKHSTSSLVEVAKQKTITTTTNNTVNNNIKNTNYNIHGPLNLSPEHVEAIIKQYLTTEVIGDGQVGLANMIHAKLLTNEQNQPLYVRTDINRNHFAYQDDHGAIIRDPKAQSVKKAMINAKVGEKAIDTVRAAFAKDSAKLNAYLPMAIEINSLRHKDAKFRQQLTLLSPDCKIDSSSSDEDEDEDDDNPQISNDDKDDMLE